MLAVLPRHDPDIRTKTPAWPSRPDCHGPRFITPGPADQPSTTARQWKLMQHTGVMQIVGRSLLWVDLTTVHVLLQCTYSNSSNYCIYIRRYTIDTIYFQDFPVARYLASAVCSSFSQSRTCGIWKTSWAVLDQICWSSLFSLHILTDKPIILF